MRVAPLYVSLALIGLGVALYLAWTPFGPAAPGARPAEMSTDRNGTNAMTASEGHSGASAPPAWSAPAGRAVGLTDRNTVFRTDAGGQLLIDAGVTQRLEALVDALPPQYSLQQLAQAEDTVRQGLPGPMALQALQLLHHYMAYKGVQDRLLAQPRAGDGLDAAEARLDALIALRRRHFAAATADAMFGESEAQDRSTIERLRRVRSP